MRRSAARLKNPVLEVLLFQVAGVQYGVELGQVVGLVRDLPHQDAGPVGGNPHLMLFEGRHVPVFPADDFLREIGPGSDRPQEAIIFDDGAGYYGMAVDSTGSVIEVTAGDDLYVFPPQEPTDGSPCRPWGWLALSDRPVLLLDMSQVAVH